mgnify:CR=1 FL=1
MKQIKFSIIMPAYNAEKYIEEAISSVLKQTYQNWELIIVDDGSTDRTSEIIDQFSKQDARVIAIHQENSGTASAARNRALEVASGNFSQMLDADDLISENMLKVYAEMLVQKDYDIILPVAEHFRDDGSIIWKKGAPEDDYTLEISGDKAFELSLDWTIHGIFLVRMDLLKRIKYDPKLINGDEFTTRKLFFNARRVAFCKETYYYRNNIQSTTKSIKNEVRMYESLLTNCNIYQYSKDKNMCRSSQKKSARKLTASIVHQSCKYTDKKYLYNKSEQKQVEEILKTAFESTPVNAWMDAKPIYLLMILVSAKNYKCFMNIIELVCRGKKLVKKIIR